MKPFKKNKIRKLKTCKSWSKSWSRSWSWFGSWSWSGSWSWYEFKSWYQSWIKSQFGTKNF